MNKGMLFDQLQNKRELYEWIKVYAGFDYSIASEPIVSLAHLMRFWDQNKETLYHLLGDKIIFEKKVSFERPSGELNAGMRAMLRESGRSFRRAYDNWVQDWYCENHGEYEFGIKDNLYSLISSYSLIDNIYTGSSFKIKVGDFTIGIQRGCKITKALGKIAQAAHLPGFENFRIAHSKILNQKKVEGILCFSIHPLDYFTMSDNEYDWDSCMNWRTNGCYRMGTVEMCNSPYVIVCYLKGEKEMRFYDCSWNSKKWRNLFIVSKDIITGIKGYPYQNTELDTLCINTLKELAETNLSYKYENDINEHRFDDCSEGVILKDNTMADISFSTNTMYNDFGNDNLTHFILGLNVRNIDINYSGETECMCCGKETDDFEDSECLLCLSCANNIYCDECGSRIEPDEVTYELDGLTLCEDCYLERRFTDPITDEEHDNSNSIEIFLVPDEEAETFASEKYFDFLDNHKMIQVYDDYRNFKGYFDYPHREVIYQIDRLRTPWGNEIRYVFTSECTKEGLDLFERVGE